MTHRVEHRRRRGAANPKAKLTPEQVNEIRWSGLSSANLARKFLVNERTIRKIRSFQRWVS